MSKSKRSKVPANLIWFEIPADKPERARKFYNKMFGWKINLMSGMSDYWHIDTGGSKGMPDGGLMRRKCPEHPVTNYINVPSLDRAAAKLKKLGGKVCLSKTAVPGMGYFAICLDTEKNMFAIWEINKKAK